MRQNTDELDDEEQERLRGERLAAESERQRELDREQRAERPVVLPDGGEDERLADMADDMEEVIEEMKGGAVVDLLPTYCSPTVAIGISVAVDALRDRNEQVAKAALETVVAELDEEGA